MTSLGLVETRSIAFGISLADAMLKQADVDLLRAKTICSGRFMILVSGDRAAVGEAMNIAQQAEKKVSSHHTLSRVSNKVIDALSMRYSVAEHAAIGIVECRNVIFGISAADAAVKAATVTLLKLVCGQGINGKSYFIVNGDVADVEAGTSAAEEMLGRNLLEKIIIPSPDSALMRTVLSGGGRDHGKSIIRTA